MNARCRHCGLVIFTTNGTWHDLNTILPECCSFAPDGKHAPEPIRGEITVTFELDVTPEQLAERRVAFDLAVARLAEIMFVQAEDGLYEQGCEDTWEQSMSNDHLASITNADFTTRIITPEGLS